MLDTLFLMAKEKGDLRMQAVAIQIISILARPLKAKRTA